jgi:hypothetical protein
MPTENISVMNYFHEQKKPPLWGGLMNSNKNGAEAPFLIST